MTVEQLSTSNISSTCPTGVNYISKYAGDLRKKSHEVWTRNSNRSRCTAKKMTGGAIKAPPMGLGLTDPPPPRTKSATASRMQQIATQLFVTFSFKSYASFDTKFVKIGRSVARSRDVLYSHIGPKFAQNPHFAYVCVQNTWKLLIFLKCT